MMVYVSRKATIFSSIALAVVMLCPLPAKSAMAVIDNSNLMQNAQTAAKTAEMLIKMASMESLQESTLAAVGLTGSISPDVLASPPANSAAGVSLDEIRSMRSDVSSIMRFAARVEGMGNSARKLSSPSSAIRFIRTTIGMTERAVETGEGMVRSLSPADQTALVTNRQSFANESAADAIGIAMFQRESLSGSSETTASLRSSAASASTLRDQMAVNTAAIIAVGEEIQLLRALISAQVQAESAAYYAGTTPKGFLGLGEDVYSKSNEGAPTGQGVFK